MERILTDDLAFVDESGRTRIFNGMNIDDKLIGDTFRYDLNDDFFEKFVERGFNLIRLAVQWANLEPQPGKYSESYLASIDAIFRRAEKYGVYILIDMHQDLFSGFGGIGAGDGAPLWACMTDGAQPKEHKVVWIEGYLWGKWVHNCFDHFWRNDPVGGIGIQDRFAALWQMLAARYGGSPALFGFDLLNEPFPGSDSKKMFARLVKCALREIVFSPKIRCGRIIGGLVKKDWPTVLGSVGGDTVRDIMQNIDALAAEFDVKKYHPFLCKITEAIRKITPNGIIMVEQSFLCNGGVKQSVPPITVNGKREPLQCFGPHSYDMTVDTPLYKYADAGRVKAFFGEMRNTQKRMNVPAVVGEWGGCSDNTDTSWFPHAFELLDYFDSNQWGQIYWDYHGDDLDSPLMEMLSRTYPVAVAGQIISYGTDRKSGAFELKYRSEKPGCTLIYIHCGASVECSGECSVVRGFPSGASVVKIEAGAGDHTVKIKFGGAGNAEQNI